MKYLDQAISDYVSGILLRYFRPSIRTDASNPRVNLARDLDLLRFHWAISSHVRELLRYVLSHRHEAQSLLEFKQRSDDAVARGRIDARGTILARQVSGHPSLVVYKEALRTFNTGPNQVVAWVIHMAATYVGRLSSLQPPDSGYAHVIDSVMAEIKAVKQLDVLREPLQTVDVHRRPGSNALRDARRSRRMIYRLAVGAYNKLAALESGQQDVISEILHNTLMGPLEQWRRFELAVGLGVGEALAKETGENMTLEILGKTPGAPIITCGHFAVFWQSGGGVFHRPALEPSEERLQRVLAAFDMKLAADRPDLVIVDRIKQRACGIVEVKYVTGDTTDARFREAAGQIVRYARGYTEEANIGGLVRASLIALSHNPPSLMDEHALAPRVVDFSGLTDGSLNAWIRDRLTTEMG